MSIKSRNLFDKTKIVQCKYTPIQRVGITLDQYKEYLKLKQELDNKNKVIVLMAEELWNEFYLTYEEVYKINNKTELIEYFESEV